jgi:hypothetical protein
MIRTLEWPGSIEERHLLIVEGIDDALFCEAFIRRLNLSAIEIWPIGGKTNLKRNLGLLKKLSGFAGVIALGIIRDADDNPSGAFKSVCQALRECNLPMPGGPGLRSDGVPVVRVMILPDAESPGNLESLCLRAISDDPVLGCVSRYFECLDDLGISTGEIDKARVQVYLASMEKPDRRLGESALADCWPLDNPAFDSMLQFLLSVGNI